MDRDEDILMGGGHLDDEGVFNCGKLFVKNAVRKNSKPFGMMSVYSNGRVHTQYLEFEKGWTDDAVQRVMDDFAQRCSRKPEENDTKA